MKNIALLRGNTKDPAFEKLGGYLSERYKVTSYVWDRQGDYEPQVRNDNITYVKCQIRSPYYSVSTLFNLFLLQFWLAGKLLTARIDCIHAIDLSTGMVGYLVARLRRLPFVYQCLDPYYAALPPSWPKFLAGLTRRLENFVITHADLFIITDLLRMPQHEGARPRKVLEIANVPTWDVTDFAQPQKSERFTIGYLGSLVDGRNLLTIIDAVGELKDQGFRLVIGTFGPLEEQVRERAEAYENVEYLRWIPSYRDILELENSFDVILHMTDPENEAQRWVSPNKLFSSMAFGKPIIVSRDTLTAKRVETIGNGLTVTYGSKEDLKKELQRLKDHPELVTEMGERGKKEYNENWTPQVMQRKMLDSYSEII